MEILSQNTSRHQLINDNVGREPTTAAAASHQNQCLCVVNLIIQKEKFIRTKQNVMQGSNIEAVGRSAGFLLKQSLRKSLPSGDNVSGKPALKEYGE
ncbi:hypothetical protein Lal_00027354 [Lupinus albus]|nr:hypothetical protein Lal_00027354 [Lupinus albus]